MPNLGHPIDRDKIMTFVAEIERFLKEQRSLTEAAGRRSALQILCGVDIDAAERAPAAKRASICLRLERFIEKERLKGAGRHWSYDINRHIALKQALDHLRGRPDHAGNAKGDA